MAARNPWILPAAILIMMAVLMAVVFSSAAIRLEPRLRPQPVNNILRVPENYRTIQAAIEKRRICRMSPVIETLLGWSDPRHHVSVGILGRTVGHTRVIHRGCFRLAVACG